MTFLVLEEKRHNAVQDKEDLFNLMSMGGAALSRRKVEHAEREITRRDDIWVVVLTRSAGADEAMLRTAAAFPLRVGKGIPIWHDVLELLCILFCDFTQGLVSNFCCAPVS